MQLGVRLDGRAPSLEETLVMDNDHISLSLELDISGESLTGHARNGTGAARSFAGWLGLLGAIDALVAEKGGRASDDQDQSDGHPVDPTGEDYA